MPATSRKYALMLLLACTVAACSQADESTPPPAPAASPNFPARSTPAPQGSQIAPDLPLLNANINLGARPAETVRLAYEFAARHPEVLNYVPCFCGCELRGHKGNDDCFVGARDAAGKVTEWETHGNICEVCIDVAEQAMKMHNSGASVAAIRTAIEERYASRAHYHTPTPAPPAKGTKGR